MTEQEWLLSNAPQKMFSALNPGRLVGCAQPTPRQLRLWACALARRPYPDQTDPDWLAAMITAECYADGVLTPYGRPTTDSLKKASRKAECVWGWLWCSLQPEIEHATTETLATLQGFQATWEDEGASDLLRDVLGNPFRPVELDPRWQTKDVLAVAEAIYQNYDWQCLGVLLDALQEAGCGNPHILQHLSGSMWCPRCHGEGQIPTTSGVVMYRKCPKCWGMKNLTHPPHARGCWVLDLLTGRNNK